jgi:predicted nucleic acid-binding protein
MILVDSNLLVRIVDPTSAQCLAARAAILKLQRRKEILVIVPQNLYEFWVVATRPVGKPNGLGMSPDRVELWMGYLLRQFKLLAETDAFYGEWRRLLRIHKVPGFKAHDTRLVAAMQIYGIQNLMTFNHDDFKKYPITLLDPEAV